MRAPTIVPDRSDRAIPERIASSVEKALSDCPAVGRVALFGSLATDEHDGLSDIDLIAEVADENGAWTASAALRAALPVQYVRSFTGFSLPSCRHWLAGESPFHQVDLSFDTPDAFDAKIRDGIRGHRLTTRLVLDRRPLPGAASAERWSIPGGEREATADLYPALKRLKAYLRGDAEANEAIASLESLRRAIRAVPGPVAGGDLRGLVVRVESLARSLLPAQYERGGAR